MLHYCPRFPLALIHWFCRNQIAHLTSGEQRVEGPDTEGGPKNRLMEKELEFLAPAGGTILTPFVTYSLIPLYLVLNMWDSCVSKFQKVKCLLVGEPMETGSF